MVNGRDPEAVAVIRHAGVGAVPSEEGTKECKETAGFHELLVRLPFDSVHVCQSEQEQGDVNPQEEQEEDERRFEGAE